MNSEDITQLIVVDDKFNCDDIFKQFNGIIDNLSAFRSQVYNMQQNIKLLEKNVRKQIKYLNKEVVKNKLKGNRKPSGFAKPNKISDELCDFIGVPHGTEKSRTDITRYINAYVKEHNLNKPTNRRIILPDDKLKNILKINNDEEVTFFILQRLISHHFPAAGSKSVSAATSASAPAAAAETVVSA
jgi:chromatin remodeling complex protein RSC6